MLLGGRSGQIFEILGEGEAGDINNSTSMSNYCNGPYIRLLPCANKVFSAWTEVWSGTYPARASIIVPEGRSGQILTFLRFWAMLVISISRQVC